MLHAWNLPTKDKHPDYVTRESFKRILFTLSSELTSWDIADDSSCLEIKLSWNQGWLEYVHKTVFRKSRLISRLTWDRGKISWVALKSLLFSKCARIPLLYLLVSTFLLDILSMIFYEIFKIIRRSYCIISFKLSTQTPSAFMKLDLKQEISKPFLWRDSMYILSWAYFNCENESSA